MICSFRCNLTLHDKTEVQSLSETRTLFCFIPCCSSLTPITEKEGRELQCIHTAGTHIVTSFLTLVMELALLGKGKV